MQLIDADELKAVIIEKYRVEFFGSVLWDILNDMPTAYDIDKVVDNLELHSFEFGSDTLPAHYVRLNDAIEIVKQGLEEQNKWET